MEILKGIPVSPGFATAEAFVSALDRVLESYPSLTPEDAAN